MAKRVIGVLGASSLVGDHLLLPESAGCLNADVEYVAFSRQSKDTDPTAGRRVTWCCLGEPGLKKGVRSIEHWICLAPIWVLPDYFSLFERCGARRLVALSSTSRFTKTDSSDRSEQKVAARLAAGEQELIDWAERKGVAWVILRPTLIYGLGQDKNISSIAALIRRCGFFPLLGAAQGLRQPIHASHVAIACLQALRHSEVVNQAYNISGSETLTYKEMVSRVFAAMGREPRFLRVPLVVFRLTLALLHLLPRFRGVTVGMAERMNRDMVFDHNHARRDFGFKPGPFHLRRADVG